jgi:peptidoglycan/LPS O-acetylase OafA/YrhL
MKENYFTELDIARGLAILGVVIIHTSSLYQSQFQSNVLTIINVITKYSVPLFIIISGFLHQSIFDKNENKIELYCRFVCKRLKRLIVPYLSFSILYIFVRVILENTSYFNSFLPVNYNSAQKVLRAVFFIEGNPAGHLYFLPLLFFIVLIFPFFEALFRRKKILFFICIAISITSYFWWGDIYLSINPLKGIGFYALGCVLRDSVINKKISEINRYTYVFLILFLMCTLGYISKNGGAVVKPFYLYGLQIFSALLVYQISLHCNKLRSFHVIKSNLTNLGRYSFDIYLLHEPYIVTVFFMILIKLSIMNIFINQIILLVLGIFIPLSISYLWLRNIKIYRKFFLGIMY